MGYNNYAYFWPEKRPIRKTVVNHAQRVKQVRTFGQRFDMSPEVMQELSQEGPFTLFCPTNEAMDMIREDAWNKLWDQERALFLKHHCIRGKWGIEDLVAADLRPKTTDAIVANVPPVPRLPPVFSLADQPLPVEVSGRHEDMDREVRIGGARVTKYNVRCWNGYLHMIDRPLIPRWRCPPLPLSSRRDAARVVRKIPRTW